MTNEYRKYAAMLKNQKLFETEELYQRHLDSYIPVIQNHFRGICESILTLQENGDLGEISYLEYTLLYTSLMQQKDMAEVRVYDGNWYFDSRQRAVGVFDFSFLFVKYRELWTELMAYRKRFAGEVTAQETVSFLLACAREFYKYIAVACRFSILGCAETKPFLSVRRAQQFEINVGEYMAHTEAVYKENQKRSSKNSLDWFSMRHEFQYAFEDFSGLDFSGADLSEIDLRYSDLRRAKLARTDFQDSMLFGTRFCHADMEGADLRYCLLHEADFTGANLASARFTAAKAYRGVPPQENWVIPGYRSISFRDANLTNADFRKTGIRDADFTGAVMDGAIIQKKQLGQFALSPEQRLAVHIVDS